MQSPGEMTTNICSGWRKIWKNLEGDRVHVLILFSLYFLQGIPIGLTFAIPLILSKRNVPYAEQAIFSFSAYSFSMKVRFSFQIPARLFLIISRSSGRPSLTRYSGRGWVGENPGWCQLNISLVSPGHLIFCLFHQITIQELC